MDKVKLNRQIYKLRKQKGVTQEAFAQAMGVTNQAVSKWESGVCYPDIQLLPDIAGYFGVSIDELFGLSKMESIFMLYEKKLSEEVAEALDYLSYAEILDKYAWDYIQKADNLYQKTIQLLKKEQSDEYFQAQFKWIKMLGRLGQVERCILQCQQMLEENSSLYQNYYMLAFAYKEAGKTQEAWIVLQEAMEKFRDNDMIYELAGELCNVRGKYEEALSYWTKAYEIKPDKCSVLYSKAYLYEKLGRYEKAVEMWEEIIRWRHDHRQDENHELDWPLVKIENLRRLMNMLNK